MQQNGNTESAAPATILIIARPFTSSERATIKDLLLAIKTAEQEVNGRAHYKDDSPALTKANHKLAEVETAIADFKARQDKMFDSARYNRERRNFSNTVAEESEQQAQAMAEEFRQLCVELSKATLAQHNAAENREYLLNRLLEAETKLEEARGNYDRYLADLFF